MKENKINVDLIVPSIGKKYNLFLPNNKLIGEIICILNQSINELTGCFPPNKQLIIYDVTEDIIYDYNQEINSTKIQNGSILALI